MKYFICAFTEMTKMECEITFNEYSVICVSSDMLTETENAKIAFTSVDVFNEFLEVGRQ
jgi:hypothetical protein